MTLEVQLKSAEQETFLTQNSPFSASCPVSSHNLWILSRKLWLKYCGRNAVLLLNNASPSHDFFLEEGSDQGFFFPWSIANILKLNNSCILNFSSLMESSLLM